MDQAPQQQPAQSPVDPQSQSMPSQPEVVKTPRKSWNMIGFAVAAVVIIILGSLMLYTSFTRSPDRVLSSFIKASQARKVVAENQFFDNQAEQNFAIVYKIPPKSFKIRKVTIEDKTATVEVDWTTIDSSSSYRQRTDTVVFTLRKDGRAWKLDRVKQGDVVNFDFLFGN